MFPMAMRRGFSLIWVAVAALGAAEGLCACGAWAQAAQSSTAMDARVDQALGGMRRGRMVAEVAVSPDGRRVAWVQGARGGEEIRVAPMGALDKSERVTAASGAEERCGENRIAWSPDSSLLAFFSDCAQPGEQADLYVSKLDGSAARRLTQLAGFAQEPAFSPDGTRVAFLYVAGAEGPSGAVFAQRARVGVIGEGPADVSRLAVARVDAARAQAPELATPETLHIFEFDWRPDGQGFAYVAAAPPGENNWWVAKLYTQMLSGEPKAILAPAEVAGPLHGLQIAVPRWSPDGKAIAFIGGLMSDQGSTGGDVWLLSAEGGAPRDLTPGRTSTPEWLTWGGNESLFFTEQEGDLARLVRMELKGDRMRSTPQCAPPLFSIPGTVGDGRMSMSLSVARDHALWLFSASTPDHPTEIYAAKADGKMTPGLAGVEQLTHLNDGLEREWGKTVSLAWKSDNFAVQGWLMFPKAYDPAKKYPLIVEVHGGPAAAVRGRWGGGGSLSPTMFSALGYFVFQPNPRGSFGQGEAFVQANRGDFGYGDLRDILAGVDLVEARYSIDAKRVGLTGWSYGGFMTMFAVTQTHRFRAAVAGAGISDWESYYGENSIDQWMIPYFGASVYDNPAAYAKSSAIRYIKQVKTPVLAVVGERDGECPAPQSFEFWHALRALGVPTELVVYPGEGHGFTNPEHRRDVQRRAVEWFARYMPEVP